MSTISQNLVPVMGESTRILGTAALDAPVVFDGTETTVTIQGSTYPLKHYSMIRTKDVSAIEFMGIPIGATEERQKQEQHITGFADVSSNTPKQGWVVPGNQTVEPIVGQSTWEKFLANLPAQPMTILSKIPHLQDA